MKQNCEEIAKFSKRDAEMFPKYEEFIERLVKPLGPLMDEVPLSLNQSSKFQFLWNSWKMLKRAPIIQNVVVRQIGASNMVDFYELMTAPIAKVMDRWFESDVLKATLGTDGVIGFAASPYDVGTG
ncbi:unnamed protein product [Strongylus vulgaris]|uniref:Uncharacterized protein n=1 Tax=Strongylus vulgaris TaxID=40348 RepID=A0A3P7JA53_STRVU|nr:unnamed protein product [Strongylus vulgaris]